MCSRSLRGYREWNVPAVTRAQQTRQFVVVAVPAFPHGAIARNDQRHVLKMKRPPTEAALLVRAPGSKEKPAARRTASLRLGIAQIDGVSLHPELDRRAKDQERREVDRQYFKSPHGRPRDGRTPRH